MSSVMEIAMKEMGQLIELAKANMKVLPGPIINVSGYGAVGDGVTDDTNAVQSAVNYGLENGMNTIFFPHAVTGEYYVTSLTGAENFVFVGDNASFVGGYSGTINTMGGDAALKADVTQRAVNLLSPPSPLVPAAGDDITDDRASIQDIIDYVSTRGGGAVFGANKTYKISGKLAVPSNVTLTDIKITADYTPGTEGDGVLELSGSNIHLNNIGIDGKGHASTGVKMTGVAFSSIKNVRVSNCTWDGLYATATTNSLISQMYVFNCGGVSLGGMIQIDDGCQNVLVELCEINTTVGKGFVVGGDASGTRDITFSQCFAKNTAGEGFYPRRGAYRTMFSRCRVLKESSMPYDENTFGSSVKCSRGATEIVFEQCGFEQHLGNDNSPPFQIQGCSNVSVRDTTVYTKTSRCVLVSWHPADPSTTPPTVATPSNHVRFERCTFDAQGGEAVRLEPGTGFNNLEDIIIDNCDFINHKVAIYGNRIIGLRVRDCFIDQSAHQTTDTQDTILLVGTSGSEQNSSGAIIDGCVFKGVPGYAVRAGFCEDVRIANNRIKGTLSGTTFILFEGVKRGEISGNRFATPFNTCAELNATTDMISITNNKMIGGGAGTGVRQNGTNPIVTGNHFNVAAPLNPVGGGTGAVVANNYGV